MGHESGVSSALAERIALYVKAYTLRNEGWSYAEIGRKLNANRKTVWHWIRDGPPKRVYRYQPDLSPSRHLAYVSGFYIGDGSGAGNEHKVRFNLADREQLEYVSGLVAIILRRGPKPWTFDGLFYAVEYDSVLLSDFLSQPIETLLACLKGFERDFLQGFFDAEGYVTCKVDELSRRVGGIQVGVANTSLSYLNAIKAQLAYFGLFARLRRTNKAGQEMTIRGRTWVRRHDVYHLTLSGSESVAAYRSRVGFRNRTKAEKLQDLVEVSALPPGARYGWFTSRYRKKGRKWLKMRQMV